MTNDTQKPTTAKPKLPLLGAIFLLFSLLFFSGLFANTKDWTQALDYTAILGNFGTMKAPTATFRGIGGTGVSAGFLLALGLIPGTMLAVGVVNIVEKTGGLDIAHRFLTPILKPLMGIPGICTLALISSLQSTDAGAGMTKALYDDGKITDKERTIFVMFQFSGAALIGNFMAIGAAVFGIIEVPVLVPLTLLFLLKLFGANLIRLLLSRTESASKEA